MSTPCSRPVHVSLGMYGRMAHDQAIASALDSPPVDPVLGALGTSRLQLCPQNRGQLDIGMAEQLRTQYPAIEWRLHANVRIWDRACIVDLCDWPIAKDWFRDLAKVSAAFNAPVYTAHAGKREGSSVAAVIRHVQEVEQLLGIPVGIEGHYPTKRDTWLFSSWEEYRLMLDAGVHYALDLSHLHIVATHSGRIESGLVREMLASPQCLEVHVSGNDGHGDQHRALEETPWWLPLLAEVHTDAVIFSEGRHRPH